MFISLCETIDGIGDNILVNKATDEGTKTMELPIEEMDLSVRSYNCLKRANISTIEDITRKTKGEMLKVKNLGQKSLEEVIIKLESMGLSLRSEED